MTTKPPVIGQVRTFQDVQRALENIRGSLLPVQTPSPAAWPGAGRALRGVVYPEDFGAIPNDPAFAAINTVAFNKAILAYPHVQVNAGTWYVNEGINVGAVDGVHFHGVSKWASVIQLVPLANNAVLLDFTKAGTTSANPLWRPKLTDIKLLSSDTTYTKTGLRTTDIHQATIDDIIIQGFHDSTHQSIGWHLLGRDENHFRNYLLSADTPLYIDRNPTLPGTDSGLEYCTFENGSYEAYKDNAHIKVSNDWISLADTHFIGTQVFSGGKWCLYIPKYFSHAEQPTTLEFTGTWDRPGADGGWFAYIEVDVSLAVNNGNHGNGKQLRADFKNITTYYGTYYAMNGIYITNFEPATSRFDNIFTSGGFTGTKWGGDMTANTKVAAIAIASVVSAGTEANYTSVDLSSCVPSNAAYVSGYISIPTGQGAYLASDSSGNGEQFFLNSGSIAMVVPYRIPLFTEQTYWWKGGASIDIVVTGYEYGTTY